MALPAGVASVRVHSEAIVDAAGNPVNGYLYLTVPQEITHAGSGMVVVPQTVKVPVTAGTFDATVVATDAAGLSLSSWTYQASEKWTGGRSFPLALPAAAPDVEYASLVPTVVLAGTVMVPALVESVNGQSGAVVLTAADVGAQPSDADLTAIAGLDSTTAGTVASDGGGWVKKTYAQLKAALGITPADVSGFDAAAVQAGSGSYVPFAVPVGSGQTWADSPVDHSATIQSEIDSTYNAGGGVVQLPRGVFYGSFKMRANVDLVGSGWQTVLRAMPGQTTPVVDYATYNAYHTGLRDLRIDGNYVPNRTDGLAQGNCRGINADTNPSGYTPWLFNNPSYTVPGADGNPVFVGATDWNDSANTLSHLLVTSCAGDVAVYIGTNQRALWVDRLFVYACKNAAIWNYATDTQCVNVQAGGCGDGILIGGVAQHWTNCKSWYHGVNTGYTGTGDGWRVNISSAGFTSLVGCESQDNIRYGLAIPNGSTVKAAAFTSGGDSGGAVYMNNATSCDIDVQIVWADRAQNPVGVIFDKTGGVQPVACRIRLTSDVTTFAVNFSAYSFLNGATAYGNEFQGVDQQRGLNLVGYTASFAPTSAKNYLAGAWAGGLTIAAPAFEQGSFQAGEELTIVLYDSVGGHAVVWNAAYKGAAGFTTVAGKLSVFKFLYLGAGSYALINATNTG